MLPQRHISIRKLDALDIEHGTSDSVLLAGRERLHLVRDMLNSDKRLLHLCIDVQSKAITFCSRSS